MDERERRRQRRYREAMRNRAIAAVFLAVLIVGIIFIVKGCRNKKQEQDQQQQQAAEALARQDDQQEPATAKPSAADNELLTLVNPWNPLPSDWEVDLVDLSNGSQIDRRCYDALQEMMDACRDAGYEPLICSAYRTQETQQELFDKKVAAFEAEGKSHDQAVQEAGTVVAVPGTSEHQLGLTVDVVDINNQNLTEEQEKTPTQKWLMANSWRYGFIHRYPNGKSAVTGIIYEPWHYRYVGKDVAQEIFNRGITLEEYLGVTH
jgi:D-alanyl-D-alanine carboxypeptidase